MQQVATTRLGVAASGNQQSTTDRNKSGSSEFSQIFEQNQKAQSTPNVIKDSKTTPNSGLAASQKSDTRPQDRLEFERTSHSEKLKKSVSEDPLDSSSQVIGERVELSKPSSAVVSDRKEITIEGDFSQQNSSQQEVIEGEHLSLESELVMLNDGDHNQWVNLLNQLLSKKDDSGLAFDDGGAESDPLAVDVGQIMEDGSQKQGTKDLSEEIVITLPDNHDNASEISEFELSLASANVSTNVDGKNEVDLDLLNDVGGHVLNDVNAEVLNDVNADALNEVNADLLNEVNADLLSDVNAEVLNEANAEVLSDVNAEVLSDVNADVLNVANADVLNEANADVLNEVNTDVLNGVNADVLNETNADVLNDVNVDVLNDVNVDVVNDINADQSSDVHQQEINTELQQFAQQLDEAELQKLLNGDTDLRQMFSDFLQQSDAEQSDTQTSPELQEGGSQQFGENLVLLAGLMLGGGDKPTEGAPTKIQSDGSTNLNVLKGDTAKLDGDTGKLLAELQSQLTSNEEKLLAAENLVSRLQTNTAGDKASADLIASLQSGIKEIKEQIKAGREPGIDLRSIVADAMSGIENQANMKSIQEQLNSSVQQMHSVLQLSQGTEQVEREAMVNSLQSSMRSQSEMTANTLELNRQGQLLQSQADKAINIVKPEAAQQLAKQVQVMVNQKNMVAEIRLDPPDLGSMKISISMQGDTASVNIVVQSQQARDMLEQNSQRLRELLEEQGIELGQSSVQEEGTNEREANEAQYAGAQRGSDDEEQEPELQGVTQRVNVARPDGIDYFA